MTGKNGIALFIFYFSIYIWRGGWHSSAIATYGYNAYCRHHEYIFHDNSFKLNK
jgi:hypothetical protein